MSYTYTPPDEDNGCEIECDVCWACDGTGGTCLTGSCEECYGTGMIHVCTPWEYRDCMDPVSQSGSTESQQ